MTRIVLRILHDHAVLTTSVADNFVIELYFQLNMRWILFQHSSYLWLPLLYISTSSDYLLMDTHESDESKDLYPLPSCSKHIAIPFGLHK